MLPADASTSLNDVTAMVSDLGVIGLLLVAVWAEWAAGNRVWFETEAGLLRMYPGRERR